jgi:phosphate transport system substrate-binding protein
LSEVSPLWRERVGAGKLVRWPAGLGAKGNEGVAGQIQGVPGSIGYIELAYALQGGLATGLLRNHAGRFVGPSVDSAVAAARAVAMPSELHVSLGEAASEDAYPLSAYTYLVVYRDARDRKKGEALGQFLWWAIHDGQKFAVPLGYAPLPPEVVGKVETALASLRVEGSAIAFKRRAGDVEAAWSRKP